MKQSIKHALGNFIAEWIESIEVYFNKDIRTAKKEIQEGKYVVWDEHEIDKQ